MAGKGSFRRPTQDKKQFEQNWDVIFSKKDKQIEEKAPTVKVTVNQEQNQIIIEKGKDEPAFECSIQDEREGLFIGMDVIRIEFTTNDVDELLVLLHKAKRELAVPGSPRTVTI